MGEILSLDGRTGEYIIFSKPLNAVQQRMWEKCECEERHFSFVFNSTCKAFWQHLWFSKVKISVQLYFFFYFKSKWLVSEECFCVCVFRTKVKYLSFDVPSVEITVQLELSNCFIALALLCREQHFVWGLLQLMEILSPDFEPGPACLCKQLHLDLVIYIQWLHESGCAFGWFDRCRPWALNRSEFSAELIIQAVLPVSAKAETQPVISLLEL